MPLEFTGDSCATLTGTEFSARGSKTGEFVAVNVSHDVFLEYGEERVKRKASEKYDTGQMIGPLVSLRRRDFL